MNVFLTELFVELNYLGFNYISSRDVILQNDLRGITLICNQKYNVYE